MGKQAKGRKVCRQEIGFAAWFALDIAVFLFERPAFVSQNQDCHDLHHLLEDIRTIQANRKLWLSEANNGTAINNAS